MDIKPENIMVMKDVSADSLKEEHIKLCDFGLSSVKDAFSSGGSAVHHSGVKGTPGYFAPEMVLYGVEHVYDARAADMWSVGCTLLDLAEEYPVELAEAYDDCMQDKAKFHKVIQRILTMFQDSDHFDEDSGAVDIVRGCLRMNPKKRYSASECLKNEWFDDKD